jgi:hypothetical protein
MNLFKKSAAAILAAALLITTAASAFAAAPAIRKTEYEGKGRVDVDFTKKVAYKNAKVTVKDSEGTSYTATIIDKDNDDLDFKIKNYKEGKTYTFTISGVKVRGTKKYGKVSGQVEIPAPAPAKVAKADAIKKAVSHAKKKLNAANIRDKEAKKDTYKGTPVWEVEFEGKIDGKWYDFEYDIRRSDGKILDYEYEIDR